MQAVSNKKTYFYMVIKNNVLKVLQYKYENI